MLLGMWNEERNAHKELRTVGRQSTQEVTEVPAVEAAAAGADRAGKIYLQCPLKGLCEEVG